VVGFPADGPTDVFARLRGQWLSQRLGQPFIVENLPGAGSTIGISYVVGVPADGYALLLVSTSAVGKQGAFGNRGGQGGGLDERAGLGTASAN
jgi:tripartite-type tricarboxylate transporter receptor subunit TctC